VSDKRKIENKKDVKDFLKMASALGLIAIIFIYWKASNWKQKISILLWWITGMFLGSWIEETSSLAYDGELNKKLSAIVSVLWIAWGVMAIYKRYKIKYDLNNSQKFWLWFLFFMFLVYLIFG
jgi:UDP-N-acetylmuramyl pentapeptide phosphotransferase/UDP-N-acetylglucosamine-1-phosphate transferase